MGMRFIHADQQILTRAVVVLAVVAALLAIAAAARAVRRRLLPRPYVGGPPQPATDGPGSPR